MSRFFAYVAVIVIITLLSLWLHCRTVLNKIKKTAYIDYVTGGLTEIGFRLKWQTFFSDRSMDFALISMEVVNFSEICAIFGEYKVNHVFKYIYDVLKKQLGNDELIAKTGENTFCFMLKNRKPDEICAKLDGICELIDNFNHGTLDSCPIQLVFGIYLPNKKDEDIGIMIQKASTVRQDSLKNTRYKIYNHAELERENWERDVAFSIPKAVEMGEFQVHLQPKVRIFDQRIVGAEALIRWRHPQRGLMYPDMFVPLAERFQKIEILDRYVLEEVCRIISHWEHRGLEVCPVSVNLSRLDILNSNLPEEYYEICRKYGVSASLIEFEIKESVAAENLKCTSSLVERLHSFGFNCALDNFGSGFCSLQLLSKLNIDTVKLDKSFFDGENNNRRGRYIAESLFKIAAQLHIRTVAEGISNKAQVEYLQQAACDIIQGFYYYKPMQMESFTTEVYEEDRLRYVDANQGKAVSGIVDKFNVNSGKIQEDTQNIILFTYWAQEDAIEFSDVFSPVLGGQKYFENAMALFRTTDLVHENDREDFFHLLERCHRENGWVKNTLRFYLTGGCYEWLELRVHKERNNSGVVINGMLANMSRWKSEVNLWKEKASRDKLTGLYNREYFEHSTIKLLEKCSNTTAALLFIDVDDFKKVNDTYGHIFGDDVLCYIAKQIMGIFRHTDIIARYGGDEFVVFAPSVEKTILEERLKRLCATFQYPYRSNTVEYKISCSIGAAIFPADGLDYDTLLDHADCALYEAKRRGKNTYVLYESHMKGDPRKWEK